MGQYVLIVPAPLIEQPPLKQGYNQANAMFVPELLLKFIPDVFGALFFADSDEGGFGKGGRNMFLGNRIMTVPADSRCYPVNGLRVSV